MQITKSDLIKVESDLHDNFEFIVIVRFTIVFSKIRKLLFY